MTAGFRYKTQEELAAEPNPTQTYKMTTDRPLTVIDAVTQKSECLTPEEAEKLMGVRPGFTAVKGATPVSRLKALGNGVCVHTFQMLFTAMNEAVEDKILRKHLPYLKRLAKEHQYATRKAFRNKIEEIEKLEDKLGGLESKIMRELKRSMEILQ